MLTHTRSAARRWVRGFAICALAVIAISACSSGTPPRDSSLTPVTLAMDWTPSSSHNGLAYAMQSGSFKDAGIELTLLPYGQTSPDALVGAGKADFAINWGSGNALTDFAAGLPVTSVMVMFQHTPDQLGVLDDSRYRTPADLRGARLGGFGDPRETATVDAMIANSGGSGTVTPVTIGTSVFESFKSGQIDSALLYNADLFQMQADGVKIRTFRPVDYGVPDMYGQLLLANNDFLARHPEAAKAFVRAFAAGYRKAAEDPAAANDALLKQFPGDVNPDLLQFESQRLARDQYVAADGSVGHQSMERWNAYQDFMIKTKSLIDANGRAVTRPLDLAALVTNSYLPETH